MKLAVAALLLTFVTAVTAGFVVYHFMANLSEKMKSAFPAQTLELVSKSINNTCLTVYVRSFASVNVKVVEAYVNGEPCDLKESVVISSGEVGIIHLYHEYRKGETYTVRIVPSLGSSLIFSVKYE